MKKTLFWVILMVFVLVNSCFAYLVKINGEEIGVDDFKQYLKEFHFYSQMNPASKKAGRLSGSVLKHKLQEFIDEYLMAQEARRLGLDKDPFYLKQMKRIKRDLALNELWHEKVKQLKINDEILKKYFNDKFTKIEVRQIFSKSRKKIEEALRLIKSGMPFEKVAKKLSEDPFASRGGKMGILTRGRMVKEWEKVAFALKPGQTSGIVKTEAGYHIIRVDKKIFPNPEIFKKHKRWLRNKYIDEKLGEEEKRLVKFLREKARIEINNTLLSKLEPGQNVEGILAKVNGEAISAKDFMAVFKDYYWGQKAMAERWHLKLDENKIKKEVLNKLIDEILVAQYALKKNYFKKDKQLQKALRRYQRYYLALTFREKIIVPQVKLSEKEMKQYYLRHKKDFRGPDRYKLSIIKVPTKKEAQEIREELLAGADFSLLARKKSVSDTAKHGGLLGWVSANRLPSKIRASLAQLKVGEITPVLKDNFKFIILRLEDKKEGEVLPYKKVMLDIKKKLWYKKFREILDKYLKELRQFSKIKINEKEFKKMEKDFQIRS